MRIALLAVGTRGDVWPHVALAARLAELDHEVTVGTTANFRSLAEAANAIYAELPSDMPGFMASAEGQAMLRAGGAKAVGMAGAYIAGFAKELDEAVLAATEGAQALVANHITLERAAVLGEYLQVPVVLALPLPVTHTRSHTSGFMPFHVPTGRGRLLTHQLAYAAWWRKSRVDVTAFRQRLDLPAGPPGFTALQKAGTLHLHPYSPSVLTHPADWGPEHHTTGYWQLPDYVRTGAGEGLPEDARTFAASGSQPLYLGLGSMPVADPAALLADVDAVTSALGVRAFVDAQLSGAAGSLPDHLHPVGIIDHDALLPLCRGAMHHGGNGTLAATLRAGLPTFVCSVFADQHFWGRRVVALGAGAHTRFTKLDRASLRNGLQRILNPAVRDTAAELGRTIRAEGDGTLLAARLVDDWLAANTRPGANER